MSPARPSPPAQPLAAEPAGPSLSRLYRRDGAAALELGGMRVVRSCPYWALLALALQLALPAECLLLLPHGEERGDAALAHGDDVRSTELELRVPLRFYGAAVRSLYVSVGSRGRAAPLRLPKGWEGCWVLPGVLVPSCRGVACFGVGGTWVSHRLCELRDQRSV